MNNLSESILEDASLPDGIASQLLIIAFDNYKILSEITSNNKNVIGQYLNKANGSAPGIGTKSRKRMREALGPRTRPLIDDAMLNGALLFLIRPEIALLISNPGNNSLTRNITRELHLFDLKVWSSSLCLAMFCEKIDASAHSYADDMLDLWDLWRQVI